VVGSIITRLPHSLRDFATFLKHNRQVFSIADLIGSLDVEEKAKANNTRGKGVVGASNANFVCRRIIPMLPKQEEEEEEQAG
jgi:hypothetical protein